MAQGNNNNTRTLTANFSASTTAFSQGILEAKQKLGELNASLEEQKQKIKQTNDTIKTYQQQLAELKKATNNGNNATEEQRKEMQKLEDAIAASTAELGQYRAAQQQIQAEVRETNQHLNTMRHSFDDNNTAAASFGDVLKANLLSGAIMQGMQELTNLLKGAAEYAYDVGSSFEASMSQVGATMGMTREEIQGGSAEFTMLKNAAQEMGASTQYTATQAGEALNYLALAGYDAEKAAAMLPKVLNLAAAGNMDLAQASDMVTDSMAALGLETEYADTFIDQMARTSQKSNTSVQQLGEGILQVGGTAKNLAGGTVELNTALGILADNGIKGAEGGTKLRNIILSLTAPIADAKEYMDTLGVSVFDMQGNMRGLEDIFADLSVVMSTMGDDDKSAAIQKIFNKTDTAAVEALLANYGARFEELSGHIENSAGAAAEMAAVLTDNVKGSVTITQSAIEGFGISLYNQFGDSLKDAVDAVGDAFSDMTARVTESAELSESISGMGESFAEFAQEAAELGEDLLPDLLAGLADLIKLIIDCRGVVGAVITALVTFKAAIGIGNVVTATVNAIKLFTTATGRATVAQQAFNATAAANVYVAVAAAVISLTAAVNTLADSIPNATERTNKLMRATEDATEAAKDYVEQADEIDAIAEEYEAVTKAEMDDAEQKEKLLELQQSLIDKFGSEAAGIDLVTGAYQAQLETIRNLSAEKRQEALDAAQRVKERVAEAEEQGITIEYKNDIYGAFNENGELQTMLNWAAELGVTNDALMQKLQNGEITAQEAFAEMNQFEGSAGNLNPWSKGEYTLKGTLEEQRDALKKLNESIIWNDELAGSEFADHIAEKLAQVEAWIVERDEANATADAIINSGGTTTGKKEDTEDDSSDESTTTTGGKYWKQEEYEAATAARLAQQSQQYDKEFTELERKKKRFEISEEDYYKQWNSLVTKYLAPHTDKYEDAMDGILAYYNKPKTGTTKETTAEDIYKAKKQQLQNDRDLDLITDAQYYDSLYSLALTYLDKESQAFIDAKKELYKWQKQQDEKQRKEALDDTKAAYDKLFAAIDAETQKRERAKEDADFAEQERILQNRLQYEQLDEFSRRELEEELQKVREEKNDMLYDRSVDDAKAAAEQVYELSRAAYEDASVNLNAAMTQATAVFSALGNGTRNIAQAITTTNNTTNNNAVTVQVDAFNKTLEQLVSAFRKVISSDI